MSIAFEQLPLSRRCCNATAYKKMLPRRWRNAMTYKHAAAPRCRDGFQKNASNFTTATVLDQKCWY